MIALAVALALSGTPTDPPRAIHLAKPVQRDAGLVITGKLHSRRSDHLAITVVSGRCPKSYSRALEAGYVLASGRSGVRRTGFRGKVAVGEIPKAGRVCVVVESHDRSERVSASRTYRR
jgi:hypothetical protein